MEKEIMVAVAAMQADQIKLLAAYGVPPTKIMEITRFGNMGTVAFVHSITTPDAELLQELPFINEFSIRPISVTVDEDKKVTYKMLPWYRGGSHAVYGKIADCINLDSERSDHASIVVAQMVSIACRELDKIKAHGIDVELHGASDLLSIPYPWTVRFVERIIYAHARSKDVVFELPEGKACDIVPVTLAVFENGRAVIESVGDTIPTDDAVIRQAIAEERQRRTRERFERMDMEHAAMSRRDTLFTGGMDRTKVMVIGNAGIGGGLLERLIMDRGIAIDGAGVFSKMHALFSEEAAALPDCYPDGVTRSQGGKKARNEIVMSEKGNLYPRPKQRLGRR